MNKKTLRTLGVGFLCASILTGAFAIFGQGHVPVAGTTINSLFNQGTNNDQELAKYREEVSRLQETNAQLESENKRLSESVSSKNANNNESNNETTSTTTTTDETTVEKAEVKSGTFTISDGEVSSDIAERLQADGYIESAIELQDLFATWDLDSMIVAGDYELNSDMSIHQIAEIITNGAYYYIP